MIRVCHLTSVHKAYDTRIFLKECRSLAKSGYEVTLIAQHDKEEVVDGVKILAMKRRGTSRITRILFFTWRVFFKALGTRSSIYHFHDPELVPVGIVLRLLGKKVIFDIHENIARQIKSKSYLPFRQTVSKLYGIVDWISAKLFYIILAENSYQSIYQKWTDKCTVVLNMPDFEFLEPFKKRNRSFEGRIELFYVGGITFVRGIETIVNALKILKDNNVDVVYHCVGPYEDSVMKKIRALPAFADVEDSIRFYGPKRLDIALEMSEKCHIGLSILLPIENYLESYSTKIFEYMAIGLPVITSDFKLYRDVIERHACGYCIPPEDPQVLANRIKDFVDNPKLIDEMGAKGITAAKEFYNWSKEEEKLLEVYSGLLRE